VAENRMRTPHLDRAGAPTAVRVAGAAPATELRADYEAAERRFGVPWSVFAAVNFVESAFGRVRSAGEAGAWQVFVRTPSGRSRRITGPGR
jgi:membrane-bound lytic murein transglycosylase B